MTSWPLVKTNLILKVLNNSQISLQDFQHVTVELFNPIRIYYLLVQAHDIPALELCWGVFSTLPNWRLVPSRNLGATLRNPCEIALLGYFIPTCLPLSRNQAFSLKASSDQGNYRPMAYFPRSFLHWLGLNAVKLLLKCAEHISGKIDGVQHANLAPIIIPINLSRYSHCVWPFLIHVSKFSKKWLNIKVH